MKRGSMRFAAFTALGVGLTGLMPATQAAAQSNEGADIDALINGSSSASLAIGLARQQASGGDISGAAATLERALLADPNANDVRLYYAAMLCRLDDHQGAKIELTKLDGQPTGDGAWGDVQSACGDVARPKPPASGSGYGVAGEIALGLAFDSDLSNEVSNQFVLVGVTPTRREGISGVASARFNGKFQAGSGYVYGGFGIRAKENLGGPISSYQLADAKIGYGAQSGNTEFGFGLIGRVGRIANSQFVTEYGGEAQIGFKAGEKARVVVHVEAVRQDYDGATRNGARYDLSVAYEGRPSERVSYTIGAALEHKTAATKSQGYTGGRLFAGIRGPINDRGTYYNLSASYRYIDATNEVLIADIKDSRLYGRAAIGMPIGSNGLHIEGAASYTTRSYNQASKIVNYNSFGAELRLIYKFGN